MLQHAQHKSERQRGSDCSKLQKAMSIEAEKTIQHTAPVASDAFGFSRPHSL
jgi:hypothetical protein